MRSPTHGDCICLKETTAREGCCFVPGIAEPHGCHQDTGIGLFTTPHVLLHCVLLTGISWTTESLSHALTTNNTTSETAMFCGGAMPFGYGTTTTISCSAMNLSSETTEMTTMCGVRQP